MKEKLREIILALGADVCGFANIDRFSDAPPGFNPKDIFPACKSVAVFGVALPKGIYTVDSRIIYKNFNYAICPEIDLIAFNLAKKIENLFGGFAVPIPCNDPYEYWDAEKLEGRGILSMKHAAVCAGLGAMGKNTLLMNKDFGNRLILGVVLTELDIESDPLSDSLCIEGCNLCIQNCPVNALDGIRADQAKCRPNTYGNNARGFEVVKCNKCRTICPMRFGKDN